MSIVLPVTGVAVRRGAHLHSIGFPMARMTLEVVVSTRQRIARLLIMIKAPTSPIARAMAGPAIGPKSTAMVLVLMTAGARAGGILE